MPLVAHLGNYFVFLRLLIKNARLVDRMAERFLGVYVLTSLDEEHADGEARMIGRGRKDGIDILPNVVEHPPVIAPAL